MVDWLHCNLCFIQPGAGANFSLTNCGHIYCEKCLIEGCKEQCRMCGSRCTIIKLSANMKPEVELFFTDPVDILRKCLKQAIQVFDFQKNHRGRMLSHFKGKISKQQEVLDKAQHSILKYQQVERELIRLREENSYLKRLISEKGLGNHSRLGSSTGSMRPASSSSPGSYRASPSRSPGTQTSPYHSRGMAHSASAHYSSSQPQPQMSGTSPMTSGRISVRTPPSDGRIGTLFHQASSQVTPIQDFHRSQTPQSVPHPISLPSPSPKRPF
ncbi:E3 ubiquitin-protein ligase RNF212B-like [Haliotis cracherodii]|uniref:E3 ubiquitin-protein ligase RNF212B-like n=1 Tax=Haliotis cracherodii TaxID=6455 RepID=UPI0039E87C45